METETKFYLTARLGARRTSLAGPFVSAEAASRHESAARCFLSRKQWTDTLGAFVNVGVESFKVPIGRTTPRGRFHSQIVGEAS